MAITRAVANATATSTQFNQIIDHLEGDSGSTLAYFLRVLSSNNFTIRLPDAGGTQEFRIQDSGGVTVANIDSDGNVTFAGTSATTGNTSVTANLDVGGTLELGSSNITTSTAAGLLKHEAGGLEFDASAITTGGLFKGASSGTAAILAKGAANTVLTMAADASDFAWAASTGALTHEGSQLTEASSNATSEADLISVTSLSIAAAKPILIRASIRKTSGTGDNYSYGLKLNSTGVVQAGGATGVATLATTSAQAGSTTIYIPPRSANYLRAVSAFGGSGNPTVPTYSADAPTADITSITLLWNGANSDTTGYCDDMHVFTVATS
jgi:hypothetical protein